MIRSGWASLVPSRLGLLGVLLLVGLLAVGIPPARADIDPDAGTSGGRFFLVNFGARAHGMGQAYTAQSGDLFALQWNAAAPAGMYSDQLVAQQTDFLLDMNMKYVGLGHASLGDFEVSGFGGFFDKGDLQGAAETSGGAFDGFTGTFQASDYQLGLNVARPLGEDVRFGVNLKYLRSRIEDFEASAFAVDGGIQWDVTPRLSYGLAVQNIGQDLTFVNQDDPLPRTFNTGFAYRMNLGRYLDAETSLDVRKPRDNSTGVRIGQELDVLNMIAFRVGYSSSDTLRNGFSFGAGFRQDRFSVDYAFRPSGEFFDARQTFSLNLFF